MQDDQKKVSAVVFAVLLDIAFLALAVEFLAKRDRESSPPTPLTFLVRRPERADDSENSIPEQSL